VPGGNTLLSMRGANVGPGGDPHLTANTSRFLGDGIARQRNARRRLPMHPRRHGTVRISVWLKNFCFILIVIVRRARLRAQDALQTHSVIWNKRLASVTAKATTNAPDDSGSTSIPPGLANRAYLSGRLYSIFCSSWGYCERRWEVEGIWTEYF
ncbi:hypothetical protein TcCL_ESM10982, partial [Trypanosoma cruzi]